MAVAYESAGAASNSAINTFSRTPGKPSGTAENDLLIMVVQSYISSDPTYTTPSGWTELYDYQFSTQFHEAVYYKIAGSSEPSTYTMSQSSNCRMATQVYRFSGADTTTPINDSVTLEDLSSDFETYTDAVTSTVDGCMILHIFGWRITTDGDEGSTPSGLTEIGYNGTGYSSGPGTRLYYLQQASAGSSSGATLTTNDSAFGLGVTIAIAPADETSPSGPNYAGTAASDNSIGSTAWVNPDNAKEVAGLTVAAILADTPGGSEYLWLTNFGFNLPSGATVDGITVRVNHQASRGSTYVYDLAVRLIVGGVVSGDDKASGTGWSATSETFTYGGSTDDWSLTMDDTDVNATNFGIAIAAFSNDEEDAEINWVTIEIDWTAGAGGGSTILPLMNHYLAG